MRHVNEFAKLRYKYSKKMEHHIPSRPLASDIDSLFDENYLGEFIFELIWELQEESTGIASTNLDIEWGKLNLRLFGVRMLDLGFSKFLEYLDL